MIPFFKSGHEHKQRTQANSKLRFPAAMDADAQILIKGMLEVNPARRLGNLKDGLSAVPSAAWYQTNKFEWTALSTRTTKSPYQPPIKDAKDTSNIGTIHEDEQIPKYVLSFAYLFNVSY